MLLPNAILIILLMLPGHSQEMEEVIPCTVAEYAVKIEMWHVLLLVVFRISAECGCSLYSAL